MFKILSGIALSATVFTAGMAPAFASPKVESSTVQQASPNLIELEGRSLTDVEAAKVEGEWVWVAAGAGIEVAFKYAECQRPGQQCAWQDYAIAGGKGAVTGLIPGGSVAKNGVRFFKNGQKIRGLRVFL